LIFDKVIDKNKLAPFYGSRCSWFYACFYFDGSRRVKAVREFDFEEEEVQPRVWVKCGPAGMRAFAGCKCD